VFIKEQEVTTRRSGPLVLIATQTKEVAKEILTQSQMFMQQSLCSFCCLFDDENINTQSLQLREHGTSELVVYSLSGFVSINFSEILHFMQSRT
jgi:hypothetical protein